MADKPQAHFKNPLHAAIMAAEFGVDFLSGNGSKIKRCFVMEGAGDDSPYTLYIHPDSLHIFEPVDGDINSDGAWYDEDMSEWFNGKSLADNQYNRTAFRDGKHFYHWKDEVKQND